MKVTGSLQEKNGIYQMIVRVPDINGNLKDGLGNRIIHRVKNLKSVGLKAKNLSDWSCKIYRIAVCFPRKR